MRQVSIRELGWEFPGWDLSHFAKFGIFMGMGIRYFFLCVFTSIVTSRDGLFYLALQLASSLKVDTPF